MGFGEIAMKFVPGLLMLRSVDGMVGAGAKLMAKLNLKNCKNGGKRMKQSNLGTIPADLHRQIKIRAAEAGLSIKAYIIKVLSQIVKERKEGE